jgi:hypothetical protein
LRHGLSIPKGHTEHLLREGYDLRCSGPVRGFVIERTAKGVGGCRYARDMAFFALTLIHGPGWDESRQIREQQAWHDHATFMDGLVEDGLIILGGPIGDGSRTMHVVEAASEPEVRARLSDDPWARLGLLTVGAIEPWALWLDGRQ